MNDHDCEGEAFGRPCECRYRIQTHKSAGGFILIDCPLTERMAVQGDTSCALFDENAKLVVDGLDRLDAEAWVRGDLNPSDLEAVS